MSNGAADGLIMGPTPSCWLMPMPDRPNPIRELLQQQMGLDAYALDGDAAALDDSWLDESRVDVLLRPLPPAVVPSIPLGIPLPPANPILRPVTPAPSRPVVTLTSRPKNR